MPGPLMRVEIAYNHGKLRHRLVSEAMRDGVGRLGDFPVPVSPHGPRPDGLICYGWCDPATEYRRRRLPVLTMDMPWFNRLHPKNPASCVKISVNHWHPTAYFQRRPKPTDRWEKISLPILPMRGNGRHIVVAGSGPKSSVRDGNEFQAWERDTIAALRLLTDREIVYRPKPYMKDSAPPQIEGARMDRDTPIAGLLADAWAVVTRQSNVAVDALRLGIPVFCWEGVGSVLAMQNLADIERPFLPTDQQRQQFFADLAYCQWTMAELKSGAAWAHIKDEGVFA